MVDGQLTDADLLELTRLVTELVWRIDHRQSDTAADLFVDDGQMILGPVALRGRDQIAAWGRQRVGVEYTTRHVCTNMRFEAAGDDAAAGTTVVTVYRHAGEGPGDSRALTVGEYTDQFVRTLAGWRFRSRRIEQLFTAPSS
jgi:SnoaL-like domain